MSTTISPDVLAFPPVPIEQLQKVRHLLSPLTNAKCSDADVRRFIRAESNKGHAASDHLEISAKRLEETVAWREKEKPDERICKLCITQPTQHYMHCIGHDLKGRPICYSCFAMGPDKEIDTNTDHMISTFESLVRLMENPESRWVSIIDFYGFTIKDAMNTKISKAFSLISGTYYPERLGESFLLDAPSIFSMLWSVISLLVSTKASSLT